MKPGLSVNRPFTRSGSIFDGTFTSEHVCLGVNIYDAFGFKGGSIVAENSENYGLG